VIRVDPDYQIYVFDRLLEIRDGPFLELGLKGSLAHWSSCRGEVTIAHIGIDWRDGSRSSRRLRDGFDGPVDAGEGLPIDAKQILGFLAIKERRSGEGSSSAVTSDRQ
jgi:hypothetical protein